MKLAPPVPVAPALKYTVPGTVPVVTVHVQVKYALTPAVMAWLAGVGVGGLPQVALAPPVTVKVGAVGVTVAMLALDSSSIDERHRAAGVDHHRRGRQLRGAVGAAGAGHEDQRAALG